MTQFDGKESPKQHMTSRHFVDESSMFDVCFQPEVTESPVSKPKSKFSKNEHWSLAFESNKPRDKYRIEINSNGIYFLN